MRTSRFTSSLAAAVVLVAVPGCGGGADDDAVLWTDEVCGALAGFTHAATSQPTVDRADPVAAVRKLGAYVDSTTTALDTSISRLKTAGPSPVDGGDEYVSRLTDALTQIRASFAATSLQLAAVDTSSAASTEAALPAAVAPLQELSKLADPTVGLEGSDELKAASQEAPNCQQLRASG